MSKKAQTIETQVSQTILEKPFEVTIAGSTHQVPPPTIATLIEVSELISQMPDIDLGAITDAQIIYEVLAKAPKCRVIGDILAVLILGHKGAKPYSKEEPTGRIWPRTHLVHYDPRRDLAQAIIEDETPERISNAMVEILLRMEGRAFFSITTSLCEINLLKQTKRANGEVVKTTQSGQ